MWALSISDRKCSGDTQGNGDVEKRGWGKGGSRTKKQDADGLIRVAEAERRAQKRPLI